MKASLAAVVLLITSLPALGNSITFSVDSGSTQLMQGVPQLLTLGGAGKTGFLEFAIGAGPGPYTMSMTWTLLLSNQAPQVLDFSGSCAAGQDFCGWISGFTLPSAHQPTPFTLIVQYDIGSTIVTQTYNEYYISPTPEPASFLLIGTGVAAIASLVFFRRDRSSLLARSSP